MKVYEFPFSVAYADTDAEGIVYHGRYIEIAERARMQLLLGLEMPKGDVGFVIRELNIKYKSPLRLADNFVVRSKIVSLGAASMQVEQQFVHGDDVCAVLNVMVAYLGANMRPARIPEQMVKRLSE
ncbi:MAG: thioesterase family protein [Alphaproteobacteria bacterium]|nr:thioesterase family protein [Alphaproteobacteria bacterium]